MTRVLVALIWLALAIGLVLGAFEVLGAEALPQMMLTALGVVAKLAGFILLFAAGMAALFIAWAVASNGILGG